MNPATIDHLLKSVEKPSRYTGDELNSIHKEHNGKIKMALCYPDLYEIGMSNIGLQILYHIVNKLDYAVAERIYSPAVDMEKVLADNKLALFSLESKTSVKDFDILGFSLQNELTYSNILNVLKLSNIDIHRKNRTENDPLIIAGGACTTNPLPLSDFIDAFVIGDGEEVIVEIVNAYRTVARSSLLQHLSAIPGIYVPGYNKLENVQRRIVKDINTIDYPTKPIVPYIQIIHDRAAIEIMRGCPRRCNFCQAGNINKPVRILTKERVVQLALETIKNTGYEDLSLVSLSSSDYPGILELAQELSLTFKKKKVSISLPSLRADTFKGEISKEIQSIRKSNVTIAPEAGTQRLRDYIQKDLTEEKIIEAVLSSFAAGVNKVKLYFMMGLPTETDEDIKGIVDLAYKLIVESKKISNRAKITVNVSTFIPKKNTPFENEKVISIEEIDKKQTYLKENLRHKSIDLKWHDAKMSTVEGVFSMGDENTGRILEEAFNKGAKFDNWQEHFNYQIWENAIAKNKI